MPNPTHLDSKKRKGNLTNTVYVKTLEGIFAGFYTDSPESFKMWFFDGQVFYKRKSN